MEGGSSKGGGGGAAGDLKAFPEMAAAAEKLARVANICSVSFFPNKNLCFLSEEALSLQKKAERYYMRPKEKETGEVI